MCVVALILKVIILKFQAFNGADLFEIYRKSFFSVFCYDDIIQNPACLFQEQCYKLQCK